MIEILTATEQFNITNLLPSKGQCVKCEHWTKLENDPTYGKCKIWSTLYAKKGVLPLVNIEYKIEEGNLYIPYDEKCIYFTPKSSSTYTSDDSTEC